MKDGIRNFIKTYGMTLLFFTVIGLLGGFFVGLYTLESYSEQMRAELLSQMAANGLDILPPDILLGIIAAWQAAGYGLVLGALGILLSKRVGLWRDERSLTAKPLMLSAIVSVVGGASMILFDLLLFGRYSEAIMASYATKPSVPYIISTVTYAAVIEEVMLRLFFMSLVAFLLYKLFGKEADTPASWIFVVANVVSAILFAAGHLPATLAMLGGTPMILFRCFLLNGGIGLFFGYLYRKYGLRYAMIAHGGCHIVSKLIWILWI